MRPLPLLLLTTTVAAADLVRLDAVPLRLRGSGEVMDLPRDERMGLAGLHLDLLDPVLLPGVYAGLGGYGAAGGDRGGLFVLGASLGWRSPAWHGLRIEGVGFAGGGGGASAGQGEGLLLRGEALLTLDLGAWSVGGGVARSDFASGDISSTSWTIGLQRSFTGTMAWPWAGPALPSAVLGRERWSLAPQATRYVPRDGVRGRSGLALDESIDLVGIAVGYRFAERWWLPLQAAGALGGGAAGYMEVLAGLAWQPLHVGPLATELRLLGGLGGGGDLDTGGGWLVRPEAGLAWSVTPGLGLGARAGWVSDIDGDFQAAVVTGELRWDSEVLVLAAGSPAATLPAEATTLQRWRVVVGNATYDRRDIDAPDIHLVSVGLELPVLSGCSLVGRARSAWDGDAGGYSEGLFGARVGVSVWRVAVAAQGQLGAGGGGGLDTADGLIGDVQLTARLRLTDHLALHLGAGRIEALDGPFAADVLEAGLVWSFAVAR